MARVPCLTGPSVGAPISAVKCSFETIKPLGGMPPRELPRRITLWAAGGLAAAGWPGDGMQGACCRTAAFLGKYVPPLSELSQAERPPGVL